MMMVSEGGEVYWAIFFAFGIWNIFGYSIRISVPMDKQRPQLDSACLKGAKIFFQDLLTVDGDGL
jgi:hypothetical protein